MRDLEKAKPNHVQLELNRIGERLKSPDPYQHAALFAAQQALCWAAQPEAYASPVDSILGSAEGGADCCPESHHPEFADTHGHSQPCGPLRDSPPQSEGS